MGKYQLILQSMKKICCLNTMNVMEGKDMEMLHIIIKYILMLDLKNQKNFILCIAQKK